MKIGIASLVLLLTAAIFPVPVFGQLPCANCVQNISLPASATFTATPNSTSGNAQGAGYFTVSANLAVNAGGLTQLSSPVTSFVGWCNYYANTPGPSGATTGSVISTYSPTYSPYTNGNPTASNEINYILNNETFSVLPVPLYKGGPPKPRREGLSAAAVVTASVLDVQEAIWLALGVIVTTSTINGAPLTANAVQLYEQAITYGQTYIPPVGGKIAVLLAVNPFSPSTANAVQNILIEVPVPTLGSIGDFVWNDANHNGIQDPSELTSSGINGVIVSLYSGSTVTGLPIAITVTSTNNGAPGYYQFQGLTAGAYTVSVLTGNLTPLAGFVPTLLGSSATGNNSVANPYTVTLATNTTSIETVDFGFYQPPPCNSSITGEVFNDADNNGVLEASESGLAGSTVSIAGPNGYASTIVTTATGLYSFSNLCAGAYTITASAPSGYSASTVPTAAFTATIPGGIAEIPSPNSLTLPTGSTTITNQDFGFHSPCAGVIGTITFSDLNANGIYDPGTDSLINGVVLTLKDLSTGTSATTTSSPVTGINGIYSFTGLCPGSYTVSAATPPGYSPTLAVAPNSSQQTNVAPGAPYPVTLTTAAPSAYYVDFGFTPPCAGSISGAVWWDANQDGQLQTGEVDLSGLTVILFHAATNATLAQTVSSAALTGVNYSFSGLCVGQYKIGVTAPMGFGFSPVTESSSDPSGSYGNGATVTLAQENSALTPVNIGLYPAPAPIVNCPSNTAKQGVPYSSTPAVTGGFAPYTYSISSGSLPAGLNLNASTGLISGTPTGSGASLFSIAVYDSRGNHSYSSCGAACSITVAPMSPVVLPCPTSSGNVGNPYSWTPAPTGGWGSYTFTWVSGALPAGLSWNASTGAISGTPTTSQTAQIVIQVTDSYGHSAPCSSNGQPCTIVISPKQCQVSGQATANVYFLFIPVGAQPVCNQPVTLTGTDCNGASVTKVVQTDNNGNYCHSGLNPGTYTVTAPAQCSIVSYNWFGNCANPTYKVAPAAGANLSGCNYQYK